MLLSAEGCSQTNSCKFFLLRNGEEKGGWDPSTSYHPKTNPKEMMGVTYSPPVDVP